MTVYFEMKGFINNIVEFMRQVSAKLSKNSVEFRRQQVNTKLGNNMVDLRRQQVSAKLSNNLVELTLR